MITRFAPSPTGPLHLGHAYSAILAHDMARAAGGQFLLRIEDIDRSRARPHWEAQILDDLAWLGLTWDGPVLRQSDRQAAYDAALDALWQRWLLYSCTCNRRNIQDALAAPQEGAPVLGPDGLVYPGTCAEAGPFEPFDPGPRPSDTALRLRMDRAAGLTETHSLRGHGSGWWIGFHEQGGGPDGQTREILTDARMLARTVGDVVLARAGMGTSYHLSVVIDDAAQGVTDVVRGQDLFEATVIHVVLQRLLGLPTPTYIHHRLIRDETGRRLAKRDDARAISLYRSEGASPADIRRMVSL